MFFAEPFRYFVLLLGRFKTWDSLGLGQNCLGAASVAPASNGLAAGLKRGMARP
eukprot:SAG11_NODE_86_length_17300_cov_11.466717_10_plen_54_part_00